MNFNLVIILNIFDMHFKSFTLTFIKVFDLFHVAFFLPLQKGLLYASQDMIRPLFCIQRKKMKWIYTCCIQKSYIYIYIYISFSPLFAYINLSILFPFFLFLYKCKVYIKNSTPAFCLLLLFIAYTFIHLATGQRVNCWQNSNHLRSGNTVYKVTPPRLVFKGLKRPHDLGVRLMQIQPMAPDPADVIFTPRWDQSNI